VNDIASRGIGADRRTDGEGTTSKHKALAAYCWPRRLNTVIVSIRSEVTDELREIRSTDKTTAKVSVRG